MVVLHAQTRSGSCLGHHQITGTHLEWEGWLQELLSLTTNICTASSAGKDTQLPLIRGIHQVQPFLLWFVQVEALNRPTKEPESQLYTRMVVSLGQSLLLCRGDA